MIFKSKYNFVILELIGQPCCGLERNNSKNVWNKSLINCFRIDSMSSNLKHTTTHLSMQHCFYIVWLSLIWDADWLNTVHVIDKHFSMLLRRNIDRYHTFFHANKWQTELAILSLQTCMLTVLAAHWLFIARTVQWIRVALRRTVQWIPMDTHCTAHNLKEIPAEKNTEFFKFLRAMPKPGKAMGSHTI